jgi:hypothetical protein
MRFASHRVTFGLPGHAAGSAYRAKAISHRFALALTPKVDAGAAGRRSPRVFQMRRAEGGPVESCGIPLWVRPTARRTATSSAWRHPSRSVGGYRVPLRAERLIAPANPLLVPQWARDYRARSVFRRELPKFSRSGRSIFHLSPRAQQCNSPQRRGLGFRGEAGCIDIARNAPSRTVTTPSAIIITTTMIMIQI